MYTFVSPLASSMMAPGLPEIAEKYGIQSATVVALTLSIFLLSFAIGVSVILFAISSTSTERLIIAPFSGASIRNVWTNLGEHRCDFIAYSRFHAAFKVLHISNLLTVGFSLGCAYAPTTGALIGFRFLCT